MTSRLVLAICLVSVHSSMYSLLPAFEVSERM